MILHRSCRRGLRGALLVALLSACADVGRPASADAPGDTTAGAIPFRLAGPGGAALVVEAYVNGRGPYALILDTGATYTCLDSTLARELDLPERRGVMGSAVGVGGAGRVRLVRADSLRVGQASARGITMCALDLQALGAVGAEIRGLLGLNFLRSFHVSLDFERNVLHLTQPRG